MQIETKFTVQAPFIGINKKLIQQIHLAHADDALTSLDYSQDSIPNNIDKFISMSANNFLKYQISHGKIIYDENLNIQTYEAMDYQKLITILTTDESSYENFISPDKGEWVDSSFFPIPKDDEVDFESRFESGNLRMAIEIQENEYDLILKQDINAGKTFSWFFFRVGVKGKRKIKLNIINCETKDMLFSKGLRILKYSTQNKLWNRDTSDVYYFQNSLPMPSQGDDVRYYHTLTFSFETRKDDDIDNSRNEFFFAYCYPYTYTDLMNCIQDLSSQQAMQPILKVESIGKTIFQNSIPMLLITDFTSSFDDIAHRQAVILTSRVHPGESNSSFVIQGAIELLLDLNNPLSINLRKKFIFKIVPMLNPDGVILGNFRSSAMGKDLNRMWVDPRENFTPSIFYTKEMIKKTLQSREIFLFCDFHGHSKKSNFFLYGCKNKKRFIQPGKKTNTINLNINSTNRALAFQEFVFPKILEMKNSIFDKASCVYKIFQNKMKTARAILKKEFLVDLSYCLESSIGAVSADNKISSFSIELYKKIGRDFILSLSDMTQKKIYFSILSKIRTEEELKKEKAEAKEEKEKSKNLSNLDKSQVKKENMSNILKKKKYLTPLKFQNFNCIQSPINPSTLSYNSLSFLSFPSSSHSIEEILRLTLPKHHEKAFSSDTNFLKKNKIYMPPIKKIMTPDERKKLNF